MRWVDRREILDELQRELVPHDARLAVAALRLGGTGVVSYPGGGDHTLQEPTDVFAQRGIQSGVFVDVLQFHLFQ